MAAQPNGERRPRVGEPNTEVSLQLHSAPRSQQPYGQDVNGATTGSKVPIIQLSTSYKSNVPRS